MKKIEPSSFKDLKNGFVFYDKNRVFRQINYNYKDNYELLIKSGLKKKLVDLNYLHEFEEIDNYPFHNKNGYKIIEYKKIEFISYPYEWSFDQLKDAALLTLNILKISFEHGMVLKDASAYNIQFLNNKPIFIDTLSFERYDVNKPWVAYNQFCKHFLAPILIMKYRDASLISLLKNYIDGIPLNLTAKILPIRSYFNIVSLLHIHLHARSENKYSNLLNTKKVDLNKFSKNSFLGLIDNLHSSIKKIVFNKKSFWSNYVFENSYSEIEKNNKKITLLKFLKIANSKICWDLGSNTGNYSRLASQVCEHVYGFDFDYESINEFYKMNNLKEIDNVDCFVCDLINPSPSIGWDNKERISIIKRCNADTIMCLALIHHLVITNNIPIEMISKQLSKMTKFLIIEFIPNEDIQVQKLLANREINQIYSLEEFTEKFKLYFELIKKENVSQNGRILFLFKNLSN